MSYFDKILNKSEKTVDLKDFSGLIFEVFNIYTREEALALNDVPIYFAPDDKRYEYKFVVREQENMMGSQIRVTLDHEGYIYEDSIPNCIVNHAIWYIRKHKDLKFKTYEDFCDQLLKEYEAKEASKQNV